MARDLRITEMFAFVMVDPADNSEGICGMATDSGWVPMVGADTARVESLMPLAQKIADATGRPIEVLRFSNRDTITTITPKEGP